MFRKLVCVLFFCVACSPAYAADGDQPLEITASQTLEWHRNASQYIARGDVVMKQGDVTIKADMLTADYRESKESAVEIYRLTAEGRVYIDSQGNRAQGDHAVYDVDKGTAVMTGGDLRMTTAEQTVTARDRFEYNVTDGKLSAVGNAKVIHGADTLTADAVDAVFATDPATGQRKLDRADATGRVVIKTPTEVLTGARGVYIAASNVATLSGGVKIERGPNVLEGEQAEVNLTTNVSRMVGGAGENGRVRGVFYPGSGKSAGGVPASDLAPAAGGETQHSPNILNNNDKTGAIRPILAPIPASRMTAP